MQSNAKVTGDWFLTLHHGRFVTLKTIKFENKKKPAGNSGLFRFVPNLDTELRFSARAILNRLYFHRRHQKDDCRLLTVHG